MPRDSLEHLPKAETASPEATIRCAPAIGPAEWGLIALQSAFWGSTFFFVALVRPHVPPLTLSLIRLLPAITLLLIVLYVLRLRLPATLPEWRRLLVFSCLNNATPMMLIILAQREVTGGMSAIFMAISPLWALLLAPWFIAEERFTWPRLIGIGTGIAGVAVLTGASGSAGSWTAQGLLIAATVCFASANIVARKFLGGLHPFVIAAGQLIGSIAVTLPLMLIIEHPFSMTNPGAPIWLAMIAMGLLGSGLAPLCHFTVLRRVGPVNAMLSSIVVPVTPVILGALFLGERLSLRELLGSLIIAAGLLVIDGRPLRWLRAKIRM